MTVIDVESKEADEAQEAVEESDAAASGLAVIEEQVSAEIDIPLTPDLSELTRMAQLATTFAEAKLVPEALQGRPADVLLVMMEARSLGIPFSTGLRELFVIDGKVSMSTKQKGALARQRGFKFWPDPDNDEVSATWYGERDGISYASTFTLEDARRVETREFGKTITLDQKSTYRQYPKRMLSHRAQGYLLDDMCPEVATGIYSPDELGAVTDADGNVIDVREVEPLVRSERDQARAEVEAAKQELAPVEDRREIRDRYAALPDEIRKGDLSVRWQEAGFPVPAELTVGQVRRAKAMLRGFETKAKQSGWVPPEPAEAPQEAPEPEARAEETSAEPETQETDAEAPIREDSPHADLLPNGYPVDENAQRSRIASELADSLAGVPAAVQTAATEFAAKANWQKIDKALRQRSEDIEGLHVDSRRMLMVAYLVAEWPESGVPGLDEDIVQEET